MVKDGAESAGNLQTGTTGEMDLQDHGVPQQWDNRPGLVSGKSGSGEKLLLLAAAQALDGLSPENRDLLVAVPESLYRLTTLEQFREFPRQHRVFCPGAQHPQGGGCGLALSGAAFGCPAAP